jgi:hypothetical protein
LYLQSELAELQAKQDRFDAEDQALGLGNFHAKECAMNWESFRDASEADNEKQKERMKLVSDIRTKLKEYSKGFIPSSASARLTRNLRRSTHVRERTCNVESTAKT